MKSVHIFPLVSFSTINNTLTSIKKVNFTLVSFKDASHANYGIDRNFAGSSSYILRHIF